MIPTLQLGQLGRSTKSDLLWRYTVLQLNPAGADTTTVFPDLSALARGNGTAVGNAQHDDAIQKFTSSSILLDGTGDNVTWGHTSDQDPFTHSGDGGLELWFYTTVNNEVNFILSSRNVASTSGFYLYLSATGKLNFVIANAGISLVGGTTVTTSAWHHVAVSMQEAASEKKRMWLDGASEAFTSTPGVGTMTGSTLWVGSSSDEDGTRDWKGNIGPLRCLRGAAPYSTALANISVPTEAFSTF